MKNRNSRMREISFHTLFCMVSMVSILLTMQKKYTSENDPLQAQITMREFQFFESIIEKHDFFKHHDKTGREYLSPKEKQERNSNLKGNNRIKESSYVIAAKICALCQKKNCT
jgi:hypothetical protein